MDEQNRSPRLQMNLTLKSVTTNIDASPEVRKAVYRIALQLLRASVEGGHYLARALDYEDTELMLADVNALTELIVQMQSAFGEYDLRCKAFMPESNKPIPAWLEHEREKWRRFELTATDMEQVDELNNVITGHDLTRRELAVIVASLRLRPEFTLADFGPNRREANLSGYTTAQLVTELERREGVETLCLEPYTSATMKMEGPVTVLKVID